MLFLYGFLVGAVTATVLCAIYGRVVVTTAVYELSALRTDLKAVLAYLQAKL